MYFNEFYSHLYSSDHEPNQTEIDSFSNINLPTLPLDQANMLDAPLTNNQLKKALNNMPNNKSPGLDRFPAEFYKHFLDILSPLFYRVIAEIKATSTIPRHMNTAAMTPLLKPNKDPTHPSSYVLSH